MFRLKNPNCPLLSLFRAKLVLIFLRKNSSTAPPWGTCLGKHYKAQWWEKCPAIPSGISNTQPFSFQTGSTTVVLRLCYNRFTSLSIWGQNKLSHQNVVTKIGSRFMIASWVRRIPAEFDNFGGNSIPIPTVNVSQPKPKPKPKSPKHSSENLQPCGKIFFSVGTTQLNSKKSVRSYSHLS